MKSNNFTKRTLSWILSLAMLAGSMPCVPLMTDAAESETVPYLAYNASNSTFYQEEVSATVVDADTTVWNGASQTAWYAVTGTVEITDAISVLGNVNLILADGASLTVGEGVVVNEGNSLTIYGQTEGSGTLTATGTNNAAGIGGGSTSDGENGYNSGTITINGGTITATGGSGSAGIGGGFKKTNDTITINGGIITAQGNQGGAGIGGGAFGNGGTVTINGTKKLIATSGYMQTTGDGVYGEGIGKGAVGNNSGTVKLGKGVPAYINDGKTDADQIEYSKIDASSYESNHFYPYFQTIENRVSFYNYNTQSAESTYPTNDEFSLQTSNPHGGTVTADYYLQDAGEKVNLTITPIAGMTAKKIQVINRGTGDIIFEKDNPGDSYSFTMPDAPVLVGVQFNLAKYSMNVDSNITNGRVAYSETLANNAYYGMNMLLVAAPEEGYELYEWNVTDKDGNEITVSKYGGDITDYFTEAQLQGVPKYGAEYGQYEGKYMAYVLDIPASDVNISAVFKHLSYDISIGQISGNNLVALQNGSITAKYEGKTVSKAPLGETVTLDIQPDAGYQLKEGSLKLIYKDENGNQQIASITNNQFTMPSVDVMIAGEFEQVGYSLEVAPESAEDITITRASVLKVNDADYTDGMAIHAGDKITMQLLPADKARPSDITFTNPATGNEISLPEKTSLKMTTAEVENESGEKIDVLAYTAEFTMPASDVLVTAKSEESDICVIFYQNDAIPANADVKLTYGNEKLKLGEDYFMTRNGNMWVYSVDEAFTPSYLQFNVNGTKTNVLDFVKTDAMHSAGDNMGKYQIITPENAEDDLITVVFDKKYTPDNADENYKEAEAYAMSKSSVSPITVPELPEDRDDYSCLGWYYSTVDANGSIVAQRLESNTITPENTLYVWAEWQRMNCHVTFKNGDEQTTDTVMYNNRARIPESPTKDGSIFLGWYVAEDVTMTDMYGRTVHLAKGDKYDFTTHVTENIVLETKWKHIHEYEVKQVSEVEGYETYAPNANYVHVRRCIYDDSIEIESHKLNATGYCECGFHNPYYREPITVTTTIGSGTPNVTAVSMFQKFELSAPKQNEDGFFKKWEYSYDGENWSPLSYDRNTGLSVGVSSIKVRAVYGSTPEQLDVIPEITPTSIDFTLVYSLPEGCEYVDAGLRFADNKQIGAYYIEEVTKTTHTTTTLFGSTTGKGGWLKGIANAFCSSTKTNTQTYKQRVLMGGNVLETNMISDFYKQLGLPSNVNASTVVQDSLWNNTPVFVNCPDKTVSVQTKKSTADAKSMKAGESIAYKLRLNVKTEDIDSVTGYEYVLGYLTYRDADGVEHTTMTTPKAVSYWEEICKKTGQE